MTVPLAQEKIRWRWRVVCALIGHDYQRVHGRYLLICVRCGRLDPLRPPDD